MVNAVDMFVKNREYTQCILAGKQLLWQWKTIKGRPERVILLYLVDETDSGSLAAVQEVNVYHLQLLQPDVEGLELTVVPVQRDHFEQTIV